MPTSGRRRPRRMKPGPAGVAGRAGRRRGADRPARNRGGAGGMERRRNWRDERRPASGDDRCRRLGSAYKRSSPYEGMPPRAVRPDGRCRVRRSWSGGRGPAAGIGALGAAHRRAAWPARRVRRALLRPPARRQERGARRRSTGRAPAAGSGAARLLIRRGAGAGRRARSCPRPRGRCGGRRDSGRARAAPPSSR